MTTLPERLLSVLQDAIKTVEFERQPYRAWHGAARDVIAEAAQALQAAPEGGEVCIVCDWKDADPFPRFIEAEVGGRSVRFDWRYRDDGSKELVIPTQGSAA